MTPDPQPWEAGYKPMSAAEALDTSRPLSRHVAEGIARDFEMQEQANRCDEERHVETLALLRAAADALATSIYQLCGEGDEGGWVAGVPPDTRPRLDAAVNDYCAAWDEIRALRDDDEASE